MADSKLADLTTLTDLGGEEFLYAVDDPAGTPADRKVTTSNLWAKRDTAANLIAANAVHPAGRLVVATDTDVVKIGDGTTAYNSLPSYRVTPVMLDEAEKTATQSDVCAGGAGPSDITSLSLSFTVADYPVYVVIEGCAYVCSAADQRWFLNIADAAGTGKALWPFISVAASPAVGGPLRAVEKITTPGAYDRKAMMQRVTGTSTLNVNASGTQTWRMYAMEAVLV